MKTPLSDLKKSVQFFLGLVFAFGRFIVVFGSLMKMNMFIVDKQMLAMKQINTMMEQVKSF